MDTTTNAAAGKTDITFSQGISSGLFGATASIHLPANFDTHIYSEIGAYVGEMIERSVNKNYRIALEFTSQDEDGYVKVSASVGTDERLFTHSDLKLTEYVEIIAKGIARVIKKSNDIKLRYDGSSDWL